MAKTVTKQPTYERKSDRIVTSNRRAFHDYFIVETIEAGIVLTGTEIKSIREGKITIAEAYARIDDGELWLIGSHISPYAFGSYTNPEPDRPRKLLVHRDQIRELRALTEQRGMTLVPLRVKLKQGRAKIEIGIARGKKQYDKRASEAEREAMRDVARELSERY